MNAENTPARHKSYALLTSADGRGTLLVTNEHHIAHYFPADDETWYGVEDEAPAEEASRDAYRWTPAPARTGWDAAIDRVNGERRG